MLAASDEPLLTAIVHEQLDVGDGAGLVAAAKAVDDAAAAAGAAPAATATPPATPAPAAVPAAEYMALPVGRRAEDEKFSEVDLATLYQLQEQDGELKLTEPEISFAQKYISPVTSALFMTAAMNSTIAPAVMEKIPALQTLAAEIAKILPSVPQWVSDMMLAANGLNNVRMFRHPKDVNSHVNITGKLLTHFIASVFVYNLIYRPAMAYNGKSPDAVQLPVAPYVMIDPAINLLNLCVQTAGTSLLQRPLEFVAGPMLSQLQRPIVGLLQCVAYPFVYCGSKVNCKIEISTPACLKKAGAKLAEGASAAYSAFSYVKNSIFSCNRYFDNDSAEQGPPSKIAVTVKRKNK